MNKIQHISPALNTKAEIFPGDDILGKMRGELSAIDRQADGRGRLFGKEINTTPEAQHTLIRFMTETIESAMNRTTYQRISGLFDSPIQVSPGIELGFDTKLFLDMYHLGNDGMPNQLKFNPSNYRKTFSPHYFAEGRPMNPSQIDEVLQSSKESGSEEKSVLPGKGKSLQLLTELYTKLGIKPTQEQLEKAQDIDGTIFDAGEYIYGGQKTDEKLFYVMVPDRNGKPLFVTRFVMKDQRDVEAFLRDASAHAELLTEYKKEIIDRTNLFYMANRNSEGPSNPANKSVFDSITTTSIESLHDDIQYAPVARRRILETAISDYGFAEQQNTIQYVTQIKDDWRIGNATSILDFQQEGSLS